jgi:hypothetical protein
MIKAPHLPELSKEELMEAIADGVERAMWQMITNATQAPCHDFFDTIGDAVERAMTKQIEEGMRR